jgi:fatty acid desaturase
MSSATNVELTTVAKRPTTADYPPNLILNITIALTAYSSSVFCLYKASQSSTWWEVLLWAIGFSFVGNTIFSLLHESVHRTFSRNRKINDFFGMISAAFFPTGFTFQRYCHLSHHKNNRTDVEMFDMYYQTDNLILKRLQWYFVLCGVYWTNPPSGALLYLFWPEVLQSPLLRGESSAVKHMGADAMLSQFDRDVPAFKIRMEILFSLIFQITVFAYFGLTWWAWLACYWTFAMNWGGLQYADHAWSIRDIRHGAWNLKVNKLVQYVFLNYHHHLAHHQNPNIPWSHLHKFVDFQKERPSFLKIYLKMWLGPTPASAPAPSRIDPNFEKLIYQ